jgi:type I restriction-modification system DNA methylase subunit
VRNLIIGAIIQVVKPQIGERIYDGACGSAGFLCESFEYMKSGNANLQIGDLKNAIRENGVPRLTTKDLETLQERTFYGKEKKSLVIRRRSPAPLFLPACLYVCLPLFLLHAEVSPKAFE